NAPARRKARKGSAMLICLDSVSCLNREGSPRGVAAARAKPYAQVWILDPQSQWQGDGLEERVGKRATPTIFASADGQDGCCGATFLPVQKFFCNRGLLRICFVTYSRFSHAVLALTM